MLALDRVRYHGAVIRPPSEASSLIVQVTYGCSNNTRATSAATYLDKPFAVRPSDEVAEDITGLPDSIKQRVRRVFLADGDALALSARPARTTILALLRARAARAGARELATPTRSNLLSKSRRRPARRSARPASSCSTSASSRATTRRWPPSTRASRWPSRSRAAPRPRRRACGLSVTAILGLAGARALGAARRGHRRGAVGHRPRVHRRAQPHARARHAHGGAGAQRRVRRAGLAEHARASCASMIAATTVSDACFAATTPRTTCRSAAACRTTRRPCWPPSTGAGGARARRSCSRRAGGCCRARAGARAAARPLVAQVRAVAALELRGGVLLQLPLGDAALRTGLEEQLVAQPAGRAAVLESCTIMSCRSAS